MSNQSIRVQMSAETIAELNSLSVKHNCTYNNKPSISRLLSQIGNETLTIHATGIQKIQKNRLSPLPLLSLKIIAPFNLSGVIALVSKIIEKHKGNIYSISAEALDKNWGILKILLSLNIKENVEKVSKEEIEEIIYLLKDLKDLTLSQLKKFNQAKQLMKAFKLLVSFSNSTDDTPIDSPMKQNLIRECGCAIGVAISAKNRIGTIAEITGLVATKQVFISKVDLKHNEDLIYLYPEIRLNREVNEEIKEVFELFESLNKIDDIAKISRLGLETCI